MSPRTPFPPAVETRPPLGSIGSVIRYYRTLHGTWDDEAGGPYRLTSLGAWAASRAPHVYHFFRKIRLERFPLFLDLGSGDGLVTCVAGLFTRAVGIEVDPALCRTSLKAARALGLTDRVGFACADYRCRQIRRADVLYIYPDNPILPFLELLGDWNGTLLVYGPHFPPEGFQVVEDLRCAGERLRVYRNPRIR